MLRARMALTSAVLLSFGACGIGDNGSGEHGSLSASEYNLAVDTAHLIQSSVAGTFIGATSIASDSHRAPCDRGANCPHERLVYIRLVWKTANFTHGGAGLLGSATSSMTPTQSPPDDRNQALFIAVDPENEKIVARSAGYGSTFAASPDETLLYGDRP